MEALESLRSRAEEAEAERANARVLQEEVAEWREWVLKLRDEFLTTKLTEIGLFCLAGSTNRPKPPALQKRVITPRKLVV